MKKEIFFIAVVGLVLFSCNAQAQAPRQGGSLTADYKKAVGLGLDLGSGGTGAGLGLKHFFTANGAVEANLLFFDDVFSLGAFYEYHGPIQNAPGLKWYLGLGPQLFFYQGATDIAARVPVGLDYKIPTVPLDFSFDWRPYYRFNDNSEFIAARFGVGIRFAF
jgi:hypothetical protein